MIVEICLLMWPKSMQYIRMCVGGWQVLENPDVYRRRRRLDNSEREKRDAEVFARLSRCPGKLDHATAVAYEVGRYRASDDDQYN